MSVDRRAIDDGIGPWTLSDDGSAMIRGPHIAEGDWPRQSHSWAAATRIPVRPQRQHRIAIVGESVARGFLLDPAVTFAGLCREAIQDTGLNEDIEIVDLAVNNLGPDGAVTLCRAAAELGSSAVVLYVGNNFLRSVTWLAPADRAETLGTLIRDGFQAYLALRRRAVAEKARQFRTAVQDVCAAAGLPVVVIVPATNLLDWHSQWVVPTWLPTDETRAWMDVQRRLVATDDGTPEPDDARLQLARELSRLDHGTTPRPLEIIGTELVQRGRVDEGLARLDEAVSVGADPVHYDRRCPQEVAAELRTLGETAGNRLVDAPVRLRERFGMEAHGRDLFLDYCHHTPVGMAFVASAAVAEVSEMLALGERLPAPPRADAASQTEIAEGFLLSALHNQHWGQPAPIVQHWITQSAKLADSSQDSLGSYFMLSRPGTQFWLLPDQTGEHSRHMYWFLKNFSHQPVLDAEFARRALGVLEPMTSDRLRAMLDDLWRSLAVEVTGQVDLLEPYWQERDGTPQPATVFLGERRPSSCVTFVSTATADLRLELVVIAGLGLPGGPFEIELNGRPCHAGLVTTEWGQHLVDLPTAALEEGANVLRCHWPVGGRTEEAVALSINDLGLGPESLDLVRIARMRIALMR